MSFVKNFLSIVGAALGSSVVGGVFGAVVALVSPEFVRGLASAAPESIVRLLEVPVPGSYGPTADERR